MRWLLLVWLVWLLEWLLLLLLEWLGARLLLPLVLLLNLKDRTP